MATEHGLYREVDMSVFGIPVWVCTCGERSYTVHEHHAHVVAQRAAAPEADR